MESTSSADFSSPSVSVPSSLTRVRKRPVVATSGNGAAAVAPAQEPKAPSAFNYKPNFTRGGSARSLEDRAPARSAGRGLPDLRDCLLYQLRYIQQQHALHKNGNGSAQVLC